MVLPCILVSVFFLYYSFSFKISCIFLKRFRAQLSLVVSRLKICLSIMPDVPAISFDSGKTENGQLPWTCKQMMVGFLRSFISCPSPFQGSFFNDMTFVQEVRTPRLDMYFPKLRILLFYCETQQEQQSRLGASSS